MSQDLSWIPTWEKPYLKEAEIEEKEIRGSIPLYSMMFFLCIEIFDTVYQRIIIKNDLCIDEEYGTGY